MKNVLQTLEASNFISDIHKSAMWVDTMKFAKLIKENPKSLTVIKAYDGGYAEIRDLRTKFNLITSGFFDFLRTYPHTEDLEMMLSCNINDELLMVAFRDSKNYDKIVSYNFANYGMLPIHFSTISLDFRNNIHILLYDRKFYFPGIEPN